MLAFQIFNILKANLSHMYSIVRNGKYATSRRAATVDTSCFSFQTSFWKTFDQNIPPVCFKLKHLTAELLISLVSALDVVH